MVREAQEIAVHAYNSTSDHLLRCVAAPRTLNTACIAVYEPEYAPYQVAVPVEEASESSIYVHAD